MRKRNAKANAIKLDIGDIKYLHEITRWACDVGVLDAKEFRRADRWVDKPWVKAWSSYACKSRTAEQAWDEARQLVGEAVKAYHRNDRRNVEAELASKEQHPWSDEADFEELMDCEDKRNPKDKYRWEDGMKVTGASTVRKTDSKYQCTYGRWDKFCQTTDAAVNSGDWEAVLKHQHNDYYKDGVMERPEVWLHPTTEWQFIAPTGIYVQRSDAFERCVERRNKREQARRKLD